ncbi:MAG: MBL fold metallo-hydrolase [Spirochaetales bacterium]|nr:MBL fold metallo-hydrolase [Spirochaetales bacterium]
MKLSILTDNNTLIDRYFLGEPGFSAYLEDDDISILFDTGYSGIFLENSRRMQLDISKTDYIVLSHGHLDHTWGLDPLIRYYAEQAFEGSPLKQPVLLAHPEVFSGINLAGFYDIGSLISQEKIKKFFPVQLYQDPHWISDRIVFLGGIPRRNSFEGRQSIGMKDNADRGDTVPDDSAIVYKSREGLVIITGCSHSGICNIIEYAKEVCREEKIRDVIGGFHLLNPDPGTMEKTKQYLKESDIVTMHPCHCTDLQSKIELSSVVPVEEAGVGLKLEF